jgi:demethylmenaquinone methyltransferase/2-methoxy-6-polyprenyl-1,4-benzoquinol methylase
MERLMALGSGSWYRRRALQRAGLRTGMSVVDVGVGTGLVAREAARLVGDGKLVLGVDPSSGMIENAIVPPGVRLASGSAESIPAPDASADFLSMGYALRHIEACVPPKSILHALAAAGFVDVVRYVEHGVFSEYRASKP